jgi:hypothetical protein
VQVDLELADDALRPLVGERRDRHDPGVVDEHVDRAEAPLDLVEELGEARQVGDVEREPERAAAQRLGHAGGRRGVEVAHGHARAVGGQRTGDGLADPASAARDHRHLAGERTGLGGHCACSSCA